MLLGLKPMEKQERKKYQNCARHKHGAISVDPPLSDSVKLKQAFERPSITGLISRRYSSEERLF